MLILISPAKKIEYKKSKIDITTTMPYFIEESKSLITELKKFNSSDIGKLMNISKNLSDLNFERFLKWQPTFTEKNANPAVFMFQGEVYQGLKAQNFNAEEINFMQNNLLILSGLHGVLRPLDLIQAYRLEMGTKLKTKNANNLYEFWGNKISDFINIRLKENNSETLVNLASDEYFKSVNIKIINAKIIKPVFKDENNGKYKIISFYAKKARGLMTKFIIENKIDKVNDLKAFDYEGYTFSQEFSKKDELVFLR